MQKQKKQFIFLCLLVIVFCIIFIGLKLFQNHQKEQEDAAKEAEKITIASLNTEDIQSFSYQYEGEQISFVKKEGIWHYRQDESISISQTMIAALLSNLSEITAEQQINVPKDTDQYGFKEPLNVITLDMADTSFTIMIGMQNTMTNQYYLMVSGDKNVYVADSTLYTAFLKSVEALTEVTD